MVNVLSLTSGQFKNVVTAASTATVTIVQTTTTATIVKISSLLLANGASGLATATVQFVSGGTTHPVAVGVNVDPEQPPVALVSRSNPLYLTGNQSIQARASNTNVAVILNYEELS